ncbi:ABC transporter permease [Ekhidna sp.]|jgi:putative ABC transport system permease protein|uniref:ABC transporter permease n=1 Tax=Ekhidna sp. TaxID=2608089 RepID=UPI0032EF6DE5
MPKDLHPPRLSLKLVRWLCKQELVEELEGNLHEYYTTHGQSNFKGLKYWYQVLNYLRPSTLKSFKNSNSGSMFIFNPVLTFRNLHRNKSTSLISIFGFTLGLVATIFLYFYLSGEVTTDDFHTNKNQIYRVLRVSEMNGTPYRIGVTSGPYAEALKTDFPSDIEATARALPEDGLVVVGEKRFVEDNLLFADQNFFEFFSYPLKTGNPETVLSTVNAVVLTQAAAKKYFGDEDPMGQVLEVDNEFEFIVSGIMDELPGETHIDFSMIFSIGLMERFEWFGGWWNNGLMTYVKIPTPQQAQNVTNNLVPFIDKYMGEDFARSGKRIDLELEPLTDVYFNDETRYDPARHGNISSILTLAAVAIAILFIACFNYVNLSIAQSFMRAKEVGVRKVLGGGKSRLIVQFLSESFLILLLSLILSVGLCELLNPVFNSYFGLDVTLQWFDINVILFFIGLTSLILLCAGVYPAMLLSGFKPVSILRGGKLSSGKRVGLRKALVVTQFAISIFLIVASILIGVQTQYLNAKDLGFNKEALVLVDLNNSEIRENRERFKEKLLANSNIIGASMVSGEPGGFHDASSFRVTGIDAPTRMRTLFTDTEYIDLLNIDIIAGRNFSKELTTDEEFRVIINERAVQELGISPDEVIGRKISMPGWDITDVPVIGVVADYHFNTLKDAIEPLAILSGGFHRKMLVKMNMHNVKDGLLLIDETFDELAPGFPMSYQFMDDRLAELYENEQKQARVFSTFSGLSIFLACLGIFGLATYSAQRRQKELGIRKVLGATAQQIIGLISREFVWLVIVASVVAVPVAWYFISQWLGGYAYRIDILDYWYVFVVGGMLAVVIALITVAFKTYGAAISDPTESIRNE